MLQINGITKSLGPNVVLKDLSFHVNPGEPLNHLDIRRERFEEALQQYPGTMITATHDRTFVDNFATSILWIDVDDRKQGERSSRLTTFLDRRGLISRGVSM
ncbi:MAG: hypothetical protein O3B95_01860 [Chloroflexi bacterium]|nr:hypothetical protein [Chloroflexota bacterium]